MQNQVRQLERFLNETDQVTLGWVIDRQGERTYLDVTTTAVEGSALARQMALQKDRPSAFSGFLLPEGAVTLNMTSQFPEDVAEQVVTMLEAVRAQAITEIERDSELPEGPPRETAKRILTDVMEVLTATFKSGKLDGGAALVLAPEAATLMAGTYITDGPAMEKPLKELAELAKDDPEFPGINFDADSHQGIRFHTLSVPIPADDEARRILGDKLEVAIGFGTKSVYLALGKDGLSQIKRVIDLSASGADAPRPAFQMNVALTPILRFASTLDNNPVVAALADAMEQNKEKDKITLRHKPITNGGTYRLEIEAGILKLIGQAIGN
jgi:hypothetical protein